MAECVVLIMGGKDGVPLRFPRPVAALVATSTAAMMVGLAAAPANADQVRQQEWWLSALNISNAWTASQGSGVTVAVLSDGVDASHPDLTGVVTAAPSTAVPNGPVATGQFFGEQGTPIASLIAGHGDGASGASGIMGVAPAARILSVPVTLPPDDTQLLQTSVGAAIPAAIAAGIMYAVSHGASVIDLPLDPGQPGSGGSGGISAAAGGSAAEQAAVKYALDHNVVLVAPAGDDAQTTDAANYPAAYPGVIAVGAFDSTIIKAPWTSRQSYVTLTAAGSGVIAASNSGSYLTMNSTSAASAIVAGIVALIRSRYPNLSVANVRTALITTTMFRRANGLTDGSGYGAVNAAAALGAAAALATPASGRAGAGAKPPATLRPAAAGAGVAKLSPQIVRAGEISAGVLVLLLLAVLVFALARRRRRGGVPALTAEWTGGQAQSRYPHAVVTPTAADRMLEYFSAPTVPQGESGGELAMSGGPTTAQPPPSFIDADDTAFAPPAATGDTSGWVSYSPAAGPMAKHAPVTGTPPWEPAAPPDGALPWSDTPGKQLVSGQVVASGPADGEPVPAEPESRPRRRPDWRRAITAASEATSDDPAEPDEPGLRTSPSVSSRAASPAGRRAASSQPDWAVPAAWTGSAGVSSAGVSSAGVSSAGVSSAGVSSAGIGSAADRELAAGPSWQSAHGDAETASPAHAAPGQHRSGLPIRQPRSVSQTPRSPSGSLWERAEPLADAESPDPRPDDDRPIFVWDRPGVAADWEPRHSAD